MLLQLMISFLLFFFPSENNKSPFHGVGGQNGQLNHESPWLLSCSPRKMDGWSKYQGVGGQDSLTVYIFLHDECVISQFFTPQLIKLSQAYEDQKVGFIGYFPNFSSTAEDIESFGKKFKLDFPLKQDHYKDWTKKFSITVTPEIAVWDHRTEQLIYRGRIDDSYVRVGKRRLHVQHHDLKEIIDSWLAGENLTFARTQAIGCFISFDGPVAD